MYLNHSIQPPFFEFGPKAYLYGKDLLNLAVQAEAASKQYGVSVIFTPQPVDIYMLAQQTPSLHICAQHMDPLRPGRGLGSILPEAVKAAGADCVMLNHAEKTIDPYTLEQTIRRADETELVSIVCANSIEDAAQTARLCPNIIIAEPTELIGTGIRCSTDYVSAVLDSTRKINSDIMILLGAGISSPQDVYDVIHSGADATGCSSAVANAADPADMLTHMIEAVRVAWDDRHEALR